MRREPTARGPRRHATGYTNARTQLANNPTVRKMMKKMR
jgi:hypothetical protein